MQSTTAKILARAYGHGKGYVFSAKDFVDLADRTSVDQALSRLCSRGTFRRIVRGVYDVPRDHPDFGVLTPDIRQVAHAIARKDGMRIQPSGALAANLLGLSTQVPAKVVYLTNGKSRTIAIGNRTLVFKRIPPRELQSGKDTSVLVIQALRHLGKNDVIDQVVGHLRNRLSARDKIRLLKDARYTEDWIWEAVQKIAGNPERTAWME